MSGHSLLGSMGHGAFIKGSRADLARVQSFSAAIILHRSRVRVGGQLYLRELGGFLSVAMVVMEHNSLVTAGTIHRTITGLAGSVIRKRVAFLCDSPCCGDVEEKVSTIRTKFMYPPIITVYIIIGESCGLTP